MEPSTERAARAEQNLKDRYIFGVAAHRLSCKQYALVAQSAEHLPYKQRVRGSNPCAPTQQSEVESHPISGGSLFILHR